MIDALLETVMAELSPDARDELSRLRVPDQRIALLLSAGMSEAEAAGLAGVCTRTVGRARRRARKILG